MERHGFIREKREIKFLILYALSLLPVPIDETALLDICLIEDAFGYLEFSEAFHEMLDSGHIENLSESKEKLYSVTKKGRAVLAEFEKLLPASVRSLISRKCSLLVHEIKRSAGITTSMSKLISGYVKVNLSLNDGQSDIMLLSMLAPDEKQGYIIEENFKKNANKIYNRILNDLFLDYSDSDNK